MWKTLGQYFFAIFIDSCTITVNGCALYFLWDWFIVGIFGAIGLSIPGAFGIVVLLKFLSHLLFPSSGQITETNPEEMTWFESLLEQAENFLIPFSCTVLGAIIHKLM